MKRYRQNRPRIFRGATLYFFLTYRFEPMEIFWIVLPPKVALV